ncbi:MAG: ATP-binding cassette domain-containing protein [Clostridiales bacterium]|nr:ATP-binding cassette domain-containing protein [Clostridiales bacterium]
MLLLEAINIKKTYGNRLLIDLPELKIYSGDRIGLVGANGSGKTTLMNIFSGELPPDEGYCKQYHDIAYIRQFSDAEADEDTSILYEYLTDEETGKPAFSGGEQTKARIFGALSKEHRLLLADEPTSNLDDDGIELLYRKLAFEKTIVLISHDRSLLDRLCNRILEIRDAKITEYNGNYSFYREKRRVEFESAFAEYQQYQDEKQRLENALSNTKTRASSIKQAPRRMGNSEARLHRRAAEEKSEKLHGAAKGIQSRIDKLEVKEKPKENHRMRLDFSLTDPPQGKVVIRGKAISFAYDNLILFDRAEFAISNQSKTALLGGNGSGKTTLLNMILKDGEGISKAPKVKLGCFYQGLDNLQPNRSVLDNALEDSVQSPAAVRMILARLLFRGDDVYKAVSMLSGGEKVKLALAKLMTSDANVLLIDEPTNYLDIDSIEAVQDLLKDYEGTLLFVAHDKELVRAVADKLLIIQDRQLRQFDGTLLEYENRNEGVRAAAGAADKLVLEMRLTKILADMSLAGAEKAALEAEYAETLSLLKQFEIEPQK